METLVITTAIMAAAYFILFLTTEYITWYDNKKEAQASFDRDVTQAITIANHK